MDPQLDTPRTRKDASVPPKTLCDSLKTVPTALALLVVGLLILTCASDWHRFLTPLLHLSRGVDDFTHGFCMGLALIMEIAAVVLLTTQLRSREKEL